MNVNQISFSIPEGRGVTLTLSEPVTPALVEALGDASARFLRALDGQAAARRAREAGEAEYASWTRDSSGEAEYASWVARLRH